MFHVSCPQAMKNSCFEGCQERLFRGNLDLEVEDQRLRLASELILEHAIFDFQSPFPL
jgi:hypothetical protein